MSTDTNGKGKGVADETGASEPVELETPPPPKPEDEEEAPGEEEDLEDEEEEEDEDEDEGPDIEDPAPTKALPKLDSSSKDVVPHGEKDYSDPGFVPLLDYTELYRWSLWRAGIAEFVATFILIFVGFTTAIGANASETCGGVGDIGIAFAFGFTVFILVYATAGISGGHLNTAVTFAMLVARKISALRALLYMILQVLGALCGAGLVKALQKGYYQRYGGAANYVHNGFSKGAGFTGEMLGTFLLLYIVFSATDPKRKARDSHVPILAPLAIGVAVLVSHLALLPVTGCGINPARSFAAASLWDHHSHAWNDHWIFWVAPLLGATLAAIYHQGVIRALPFRYLPQILGDRYGA